MHDSDRAPTAAELRTALQFRPWVEDVLPHYGRVLAEVREQTGLGLRPMAEAIESVNGHADYSSMSRWEAGKMLPTDPAAILEAYARVAELDPEDLWTDVMDGWTGARQHPSAVKKAKQLPRP